MYIRGKRRAWWLPVAALIWFGSVGPVAAAPPAVAELARALQTILNAPPDAPIPDSAAAWKVVSAASFDQLPQLLAAMDQANPVAANWISTAIDRVFAVQTVAGRAVPVPLLEAAALDQHHALLTRRLALELLEQAEPGRMAAVQEQLLNDPEAFLRRPAVEMMIQRARKSSEQNAATAEQLAVWRQALAGARDQDQVITIAKALRELGAEVDLARQFGYLRQWQVIGPFENIDLAGFDYVYPPESLTSENYSGPEGIFSGHAWPGKDGPVRWKSWTAPVDSGNVDLNEAIGKLKEVTGYGATIYLSDEPREADLRIQCQNAFKIWVNGQLIVTQPVCHTGNAFDQYQLRIRLRRGENRILVKSCQIKPPQVMEWYDAWHFSLRICDSTGLGIPPAVAPEAANK